MPPSAERRRALTAAAAAALLLASLTGLAGCGDNDGRTPAAATSSFSGSAPASADASATASTAAPPSASPSVSVSATSPVPGSPSTPPVPAPATVRATPPPVSPTPLRVAVDTRGGGLALVRGGAAQEFTVTLRNGNSTAYRHLLVAFQMESLVGEPGGPPAVGPGFVLERFDAASGTWRAAELRVANDRMPESVYTGGAALARDGVRVERYRLRATAGGPAGSSPLMVSFIDTDADRRAAAQVLLPHTTR